MDSADTIAAEARGMASSALGAVASLERYNALQMTNITKEMESIKEDADKKHTELKLLIEATCVEMRAGFRTYENKFWSLAVALIGILLTICAFLIVKVFFGVH